jgi:dTDP-4-amino-4,6-dideoxygalactose transaminase
VHLQPAFRERHLGGSHGLPQSERACNELICLPVHPQLTDVQVAEVATHVIAWCQMTGGRA